MLYFSAKGRSTSPSRPQTAMVLTDLELNVRINSLENSACPRRYMPTPAVLVNRRRQQPVSPRLLILLEAIDRSIAELPRLCIGK